MFENAFLPPNYNLHYEKLIRNIKKNPRNIKCFIIIIIIYSPCILYEYLEYRLFNKV